MEAVEVPMLVKSAKRTESDSSFCDQFDEAIMKRRNKEKLCRSVSSERVLLLHVLGIIMPFISTLDFQGTIRKPLRAAVLRVLG